jgi:hypothetical protein
MSFVYSSCRLILGVKTVTIFDHAPRRAVESSTSSLTRTRSSRQGCRENPQLSITTTRRDLRINEFVLICRQCVRRSRYGWASGPRQVLFAEGTDAVGGARSQQGPAEPEGAEGVRKRFICQDEKGWRCVYNLDLDRLFFLAHSRHGAFPRPFL